MKGLVMALKSSHCSSRDSTATFGMNTVHASACFLLNATAAFFMSSASGRGIASSYNLNCSSLVEIPLRPANVFDAPHLQPTAVLLSSVLAS